ncbi:hypothetical protein MMC18_007895, partial [Xylographa bjoerkii]|nr:hypothetical protein [Xylographa bjoerkii]
MAGFGWSVGDLALAVKFVVQTGQALKETGGAAADYQDSVDSLHGIAYTLKNLEQIGHLYHMDTSAEALTTEVRRLQTSLVDFIDSIQKYEEKLGVNRKKGIRHGLVKKIQWATFVAKKVKELQSKTAVPMSSINANLNMQVMYMLSSIGSSLPTTISNNVANVVNEVVSSQLNLQSHSLQQGIDQAVSKATTGISGDLALLRQTLQHRDNSQAASRAKLENAIINNLDAVSELHSSVKMLGVVPQEMRLHRVLKTEQCVSPWPELQDHIYKCICLFALGLQHLLFKLFSACGLWFRRGLLPTRHPEELTVDAIVHSLEKEAQGFVDEDEEIPRPDRTGLLSIVESNYRNTPRDEEIGSFKRIHVKTSDLQTPGKAPVKDYERISQVLRPAFLAVLETSQIRSVCRSSSLVLRVWSLNYEVSIIGAERTDSMLEVKSKITEKRNIKPEDQVLVFERSERGNDSKELRIGDTATLDTSNLLVHDYLIQVQLQKIGTVYVKLINEQVYPVQVDLLGRVSQLSKVEEQFDDPRFTQRS